MIIDELFEAPQQCPECGGISFSDLILAEKKDACYHKVKASAKVWPSAYASGRLVQCRKKGAANYGKSKTESVSEGVGNIGDQIKAVYQKIYDQGDDAVEFMYYDSPIFAQYWDEYEGDLDSIIAEVDPGELQIIHDELLSAAEQQGVAEGSDGAVSFREMIDVVDQHYPKYYAELSGSDISDKQFERAIVNAYKKIIKKQGMAEQQELDEKWSAKYKSSINCANPQGFSQRAHCAGRKKNEDVDEGVMYGAENLHVGDDVIISGNVEFNGATGVIDSFGQDKRFVVVDLYNHGRHSFHSSDVSANDYENDEHDDDMVETRKGQVPMTLKPGETDNLEPENIAGFRQLPTYKQGQAAQQKAGKQLIQKSPYTFQSDQDWAYRQGATDAQRAAMFANFGGTKPLTTAEGEQQPGADYRDPKEVDYDGEYDAMVARVKKLAGLGPMKTVYDPNKRVYRNMPTAQQPKK
jgi:hypothetical protein